MENLIRELNVKIAAVLEKLYFKSDVLDAATLESMFIYSLYSIIPFRPEYVYIIDGVFESTDFEYLEDFTRNSLKLKFSVSYNLKKHQTAIVSHCNAISGNYISKDFLK